MTAPTATWETRVRTLLMQRSGEERLRMGCSMFDAARAFACAGLGDSTCTDRSCAMREGLFLRTYGNDFAAATRERIVAHLRSRS
ncbi:hypothetical protein L6Q96_06670 [Candidatus Binatia bacterium]|nr:hypothetical protein [Candidatus Binatia bacterium]